MVNFFKDIENGENAGLTEEERKEIFSKIEKNANEIIGIKTNSILGKILDYGSFTYDTAVSSAFIRTSGNIEVNETNNTIILKKGVTYQIICSIRGYKATIHTGWWRETIINKNTNDVIMTISVSCDNAKWTTPGCNSTIYTPAEDIEICFGDNLVNQVVANIQITQISKQILNTEELEYVC